MDANNGLAAQPVHYSKTPARLISPSPTPTIREFVNSTSTPSLPVRQPEYSVFFLAHSSLYPLRDITLDSCQITPIVVRILVRESFRKHSKHFIHMELAGGD